MKHAVHAAGLLAAFCLILSCAATEGPGRPLSRSADLVFRNGAVYTVDAARSSAEAVAVARGRIVWVGPESGAAAWIGPRTRVVDLAGRMLLPGFHDVHTHLVEGGVQLAECRLGSLDTVEKVIQEVRGCAERHPAPAWIRGGGWQLPLFPEANPHKSLLDQAAPGRAVALTAADGHSVWVSSKALELAGITRETPDPPNGRIERDPRTGEPTGTLREAAIGLVSKVVPPRSDEELREGLRRALQEVARSGITSIQDAATGEKGLAAYADLDRRGELTVRVVAALRVDLQKGVDDLPRLVALREKYRQGSRLRVLSAKIFADGVIEAKTAALLAPYLGTDDRGPANLTPEVMDRLVAALDREGFQVHVHAIGDRAVRMSLDAFEKAHAANGQRDARHQIAHLELIDPQDIPRFQRLGVIADFQPLWAFADPYIVKLTVPVLGEERSRWLYPIGSVARTGAVLACGSDWDVTPMNVPLAIQVGVTRRDPSPGAPAEGPAWLPEHLVDLPAMLACYTINGAYTNFEEKETGSIEVGKAADLVVLDRNLFKTPKNEIGRTKVLLTLLEGKEVWRDPGF